MQVLESQNSQSHWPKVAYSDWGIQVRDNTLGKEDTTVSNDVTRIEVHNHRGNTLNDALMVTANMEATRYTVSACGIHMLDIVFQSGNPSKMINGVSNEMLLAIVMDRLRFFQTTEYVCPENDEALGCLAAALATLKSRTTARQVRGVEGTATL